MLFLFLLLLCNTAIAMEENVVIKDHKVTLYGTALYFAQEKDLTKPEIDKEKADKIYKALKKITGKYEKLSTIRPGISQLDWVIQVWRMDDYNDQSFQHFLELNRKLNIPHYNSDDAGFEISLNQYLNIAYVLAEYNKIKGFKAERSPIMKPSREKISFEQMPNGWRFTFNPHDKNKPKSIIIYDPKEATILSYKEINHPNSISKSTNMSDNNQSSWCNII
jgi:hypothetical protein